MSLARAAAACCTALMLATASACGSKAVLTQQAEAYRLSSDLPLQFTRAADASNRAVMADTDEASTAAAREALQATQAVQRDVDALREILQDLGDRTELGQLDAFKARFNEYRKLDNTILPLAVENTNIKAQRLSFGPAQEAVHAFRESLEASTRLAAMKDARVAALAATATAALLEVQVLQARHIAESDDAAMSRMEATMQASEAAARQTLDTLQRLLPPASRAHAAAAAAALDRFTVTNAEIVALSRRNSNVRSLALSLGKKRTVTAECSDLLLALNETLTSRHFAATR